MHSAQPRSEGVATGRMDAKVKFDLPTIWLSAHQNEYISNEMEKSLYGPSWWMIHTGLVRPGDLFVDVGFNIGGVGIVMAALGMQLIGFEPVRANWIVGQQSIRLNHLQDRAVVHNAAVHYSGQPMLIQHNFSLEPNGAVNAGQGTLGANPEGTENQIKAGLVTSGSSEMVDTMRLDDAVQQDVAIMKLDVEGCECHVLKSGNKLFEQHEVHSVFIETDARSSKRCGCTAAFYVEFFTKHGFVACPQFEGTKQGDPERGCGDGTTEKPQEHTWFSLHDRWLRRAGTAPFPGRPYH